MYLYIAPRSSRQLPMEEAVPHGLNSEPRPSMLLSWLNPAVASYMEAEGLFMKRNFAAIILGGTGQVGGAAVAELLTIPECREVVMVTRKTIASRSRVRNVVLDTGAADFAERTAALAVKF